MKKKGFKIILVVFWMGVIFYFSNQPAAISNEKSHGLINFFQFLGVDLNNILGDMTNFIVRKSGHFSEYLVLYLLLYTVFIDKYSRNKALGISLLLVFFYAGSDELHQRYVPGREGMIRDVFIDTFGGVVAMMGIYLKGNRKLH